MAPEDFHERTFDESTLTKLELFELYTREWLPVFLSRADSPWKSIHVFDFFAGPGGDGAGNPGSPLRILRQLDVFQGLPGWAGREVVAHFFDESEAKIDALRERVRSVHVPTSLRLDIRKLDFSTARREYDSVLRDRHSAKLLFVDQFGVRAVTEEVFQQLIGYPTADFLFFVSSSIFFRFPGHPNLEERIVERRGFNEAHQEVLESYRAQAPAAYFLAPFSLKKGSNIYGIIFGSAHPKGIDKFLELAWQKDQVHGQANFDIHGESISHEQPFLPNLERRPNKLTEFESSLEAAIRDGRLDDEMDVVRFCFRYGVRRKHAVPVLRKLAKEGVIDDWRGTPQFDRRSSPRRLRG